MAKPFRFIIAYTVFSTVIVAALLLADYGTNAEFTANLKFPAYRPNDAYKCGEFIAATINDPAMRIFHRFNNALIRLLSRPFPHEQLISREAIQGDLNEWRASFETKYMTWLDFERNWIAVCVALIVLAVGFTLLYLLYRCCACCCAFRRRHRRSTDAKKSVRVSEGRHDVCQRILLDILISAFIIVNLFASVVLLMSTQYAQYGVDQLPTRLSFCVNDLSVYKFDNSERIRKLLFDDFQILNETLVRNVNEIGVEVVQKFKLATGADFLDQLEGNLSEVQMLQEKYLKLRLDLMRIQTSKRTVSHQLARLRESEMALRACAVTTLDDSAMAQARERRDLEPNTVDTEVRAAQLRGAHDASSTRVCRAALQFIQPLINNDETNDDDEYINRVLPAGIANALREYTALGIAERLRPVGAILERLQLDIQNLVSERRPTVLSRLQQLERTLNSLYMEISSGIKNVDLKHVEELFNPMMDQRERLRTYTQYIWIISLVFTGVFMFIACSFLLGLFYGCCGRRPGLYDDDCCVRATGSKFYSCGIWLCISFMTFFALITAVLIFVGANASHLVCHPLRDPLNRPDMLSFLDRLIDAYGLDDSARMQHYGLPAVLTRERRPVDLLRGCALGETFYAMLGLDRKFRLMAEGGPMDEYMELADALKTSGAARSLAPRDDMRFYAPELERAVQQLAAIHLPSISVQNIQEYQLASAHFAVDTTLHQLRKLLAELQDGAPAATASTASNILAALAHQLDHVRTDAQNVTWRIDEAARRLTQMSIALERIGSALSGGETLVARLREVDAAIGTQAQAAEFLDAGVEATVDDMTRLILQYARHINDTMRREISSCAPIAQIARNTRAAICDHTLDPFNGVWMAMAISIVFMVPIILLATRLISLYDRVDPLHNFSHFGMRQYQAAPTTATDSILNNIDGGYGSGSAGGYYGIGEPLTAHHAKPTHYSGNGFGSSAGSYGCQATDDYFAYQQFPPPYGNGVRR